jgi:hypothetical protein
VILQNLTLLPVKCESCGKIFNFSIDLNFFETEELSGFNIIDRTYISKAYAQDAFQI